MARGDVRLAPMVLSSTVSLEGTVTTAVSSTVPLEGHRTHYSVPQDGSDRRSVTSG